MGLPFTLNNQHAECGLAEWGVLGETQQELGSPQVPLSQRKSQKERVRGSYRESPRRSVLPGKSSVHLVPIEKEKMIDQESCVCPQDLLCRGPGDSSVHTVPALQQQDLN